MTTATIKIRIDNIVAERILTSIAPAYGVSGQVCAQCGGQAWHADGTAFCLKHDQNTLLFADLDGLTETERKESLRILALWV
jgi:class 3 adenylate cyclase